MEAAQENNCVTVNRAEGNGRPKDPCEPFDRQQELEFALLAFSLVLVQASPQYDLIPPFGMVVHILCHYVLEVCNFLFDFYFKGSYSLSRRDTFDFGLLVLRL